MIERTAAPKGGCGSKREPPGCTMLNMSTKSERLTSWATLGYQAMIMDVQDYDTQGAPRSWAKIFAMRHALSKYPDCQFIWYLDQDAYIMDPSKSLDDQVTNARKLESLMIKDYPVVPPDSIIKTFSHLRGDNIDLIVCQDKEGLVHQSVVIRNGEWAKFFVETWFDPMYRNYNFQKAERHALVSILILPSLACLLHSVDAPSGVRAFHFAVKVPANVMVL